MGRRSLVEIERDRTRTVELHIRGLRQEAIARDLGLKRQQVTRWLHRAQAEFEREQVQSRVRLRNEQLLRLDMLEREAWREWERSKEDREIKGEKIVAGEGEGAKNRAEQTQRTEGRLGDVGYLRAILDVIKERSELAGLNVPTEGDKGLAEVAMQAAAFLERRRQGGPNEWPR